MHNPSILARVFLAGVALVTVTAGATRTPETIKLRSSASQVKRYGKIEIAIEIDTAYDHPYDPCVVEVDLLIESPSGQSLVQPAFFGQDFERIDRTRSGRTVAWCYPINSGSWKARLAPTETGTYTIQSRVRDRQSVRTSDTIQIECLPSTHRGFLHADPVDPRFLAFSEGQPFFAIGQNLAFIGPSQYVNLPKAEAILDRLARNGANFLRIWTCCDDWALAIESPKSAWTRSWNRESPIVTWPGGKNGSDHRKCVELKGADGASIAVAPSHSVALRPNTRYVLTGQFRADGPTGLQIQVGVHRWELPCYATQGSPWLPFQRTFTTGQNDYWLGATSLSLIGTGSVWLDGLSLKEADGNGAELLWEANVNLPARGDYNQLDCFMLDQIVTAAERNGIYLMLCVLTRDLYMNALSTVESPAYRQATEDAKKLMRYAVARWGHSTSVAAWEYFNEMDPGQPTDRFYTKVGAYLDRIDIHHHLKATSTWHPSARDCGLADLDLAQLHHYLRPREDDFKNEVQAIVHKVAFLRRHAANKPALIAEFGLATDKWGLSDYMKQDHQGIHFHNSLWASAFSGASGTTLFWWWDQLDRQEAYRHYRPLEAYLVDVSLAELKSSGATSDDKQLEILGYQGDDCAYLWLFNRRATWWNLVVEKQPSDEIEAATVEIEGLMAGEYTVQWWNTYEGRTIQVDQLSTDRDTLSLAVPPFARDMACKVRRR